MQFSIRDDLAAAFMGAFYQVLAGGRTIDEAVARGRAAIRMKALGDNGDIRDWGAPVLYLRAPGGRIFNPLSDEAVRKAVEKEVTRLVEQHITGGIAPSGVVVGEVTKDVDAGEVEIIQKVDKDLEGLMVGSYAVDIKGGRITVRMKADRVTGTMIGSVMTRGEGLTGAKGWAKLDELLQTNFKAVKPSSPPPGESGAEEAPGLTCPACGSPAKEGAKFCENCGTKLKIATKFCSQCGAELRPGAKFCDQCGANTG
jgi:membrane protease subunit (stomatin/prohibitin family)